MKKAIIVLLVLVSVLIVGCATQENNVTNSENVAKQAVNASFNTDQALKECEIKQNENQKSYVGTVFKIDENCLYEKAQTMQDCKSYEGKTVYIWGDVENKFETENVEECIFRLALRNNNSTLCHESGSKEEECFTKVAISKKDPDVCLETKNLTLCYSKYVSSLDINQECAKEGGGTVSIIACTLKELNINKSALDDLNDISLCALSEQFAGYPPNELASVCVSSKGVYLQDKNLCDKAGNHKEECYMGIARSNPSFTLSDCDKAGTDYVGCYIEIALKNRDPSICLKIPKDVQGNCIYAIAQKTLNFSLCVEILDIDPQLANSGCAFDIANKIGLDNMTYQNCIDLSKFERNAALATTDQCFYKVGIRDLNLDACNKIEDSSAKSDCTTRVQHAISSR